LVLWSNRGHFHPFSQQLSSPPPERNQSTEKVDVIDAFWWVLSLWSGSCFFLHPFLEFDDCVSEDICVCFLEAWVSILLLFICWWPVEWTHCPWDISSDLFRILKYYIEMFSSIPMSNYLFQFFQSKRFRCSNESNQMTIRDRAARR
jgi:hypothetical protein